jgi:hypothetical protein
MTKLFSQERGCQNALAGLSTKIWRHVVEPNAQSAADFRTCRAQVAGEGMVSNRADGTVDVYYFLDPLSSAMPVCHDGGHG